MKSNLDKILESAKDPHNIYTSTNLKQQLKDLVFQYEQPNVVGIVDAGLVPKEDQVIKEQSKMQFWITFSQEPKEYLPEAST